MEQVILARHAESEYSAHGALNGDPRVTVDLTPEGREQARRLGLLLESEPIDLCVTTEFGRTKQTADIALAGRRDIPRVTLPELNDVQAGDFESRPVEDYRAWLRENGPAVAPPGGGESRSETVLRFCKGFRKLLSRPERRILVVTHGLPIKCVLLATQGEEIPLVMQQPEYAVPYRFSAASFERGIERLEDWAKKAVPA